jgi:hypothetical protein
MFEQDLITEIQTLLKNVSILYKYVDFNGGLELLSNSNLLIKNPTQFNDPYDCFPGLIDFDKMPDDYIKYLINKYDSHLNRRERRDKIKFNIKKSKNGLIESLKNDHIDMERNSRGITCFSKQKDNLLMWSQYADSHRGMCIGFNLERLYRSLKDNRYKETALLEVIYTNDLISNNYFEDSYKAVIDWLRTKSDSWKYEDEVRVMFSPIIFDKTNIKFVAFDKNVIEEIYFGSKILNQNEETITKMIENSFPKVNMFKMRLSTNEFKLISNGINKSH